MTLAMTPITPTASFKDNLALLPAIDGIAHLDLIDAAGTVVATIPNEAGKQGSLKVYNYLQLCFGKLDAAASVHALEVFAEHTPDARARPGAHPNIDRLIDVIEKGTALQIRAVP